MKFEVPLIVRIGALVVATTALYTYIGQLVPQKTVEPPQVIEMASDMTTQELIGVGRGIFTDKGLCSTCHTIGQSGALRFPDLGGIGSIAATRIEGLDDVGYLAQSLYEPDIYIVEGFSPGMPAIQKPPIALTEQEILAVIAYLQSLGGQPSVTLQTETAYSAGGQP